MAIRREVRAEWNIMIRREKLERGKMLRVAGSVGDATFARFPGKVTTIHQITHELTPSPQGPGED